jgi:hypothetical protein
MLMFRKFAFARDVRLVRSSDGEAYRYSYPTAQDPHADDKQSHKGATKTLHTKHEESVE